MRLHGMLVPAVCLLLLAASGAAARKWTDQTGKYTVEAELVEVRGDKVVLKKPTGEVITVSIGRLSAADRQFLANVQDGKKNAGGELPAAVVKFKAAMESMRPIETRRIEKRLEKLQEQLRSGQNQMRHPLANEARLLSRNLTQRLKLLESGEPFVPRISPKDFQVGQIGELDDDLGLFAGKAEKDGSVYIYVTFAVIEHKMPVPQMPSLWHRTTVSRPDRFHLRAPFAADLPAGNTSDFDRNSPTNRLLRSHVYEVIDKEPRGMVTDYVLTPFPMDEVQAWLAEEAKRRG